MDKDGIKWVRDLPLGSLNLVPQTLRFLLERIGDEGRDAAMRFRVGDVMDAVEAQEVFNLCEICRRSDGSSLHCFYQHLVKDYLLTYLDWRFLPFETAMPLLSGLSRDRLVACDARVLGTFPDGMLLYPAKELGIRIHYERIVAPDGVTIAKLLASASFVTAGEKNENYARALTSTKAKLRKLGFRKKDAWWLE